MLQLLDWSALGGGTTAPPADAPVAAFSGTPLSGDTPLLVTFTDASTNTPTDWLWSFGVAGSSILQNPTYTYTAPGTYTVTLTASNADGSDVETKVAYVTVTEEVFNPPAPTAGGYRLRRFPSGGQ